MNIWIKRIIKAIAIWLLLIMIYLTLNLWFNVNIPIVSNFSKNKSPSMEMEFLATSAYASTLDEQQKKELIQKEYIYHPKYKEKMENEEN